MEGISFGFGWEVSLIEGIQSVMGPLLIFLSKLFSYLGDQYVLVVVLAFLYFWFDKDFGKRLGVVMLYSLTLGSQIKNLVLRRRPYFDNGSIRCLHPVEKNADIYDIQAQGFSFPSLHSTLSVVTFGSLAGKTNKKWVRCVLYALPVLVGISRISVGAHYPTDVIAGWLIGVIVALLIGFLSGKIKKEWLSLIIVLAALPGVFFCRSDDYFSSFGLLIGFIASDLFEDRFVKFGKPKTKLAGLLRVVFGLGLFAVLRVLSKLPFDEAFLGSATPGAFAVRTVSYAVILFVVMGLYPMLFRIKILK